MQRPTITRQVYPEVPKSQIYAIEDEEKQIDTPYRRIIDDTARLLPYRRRFDTVRLTIHVGQLKLLMNEIEFLLQYGHLSKTIIYAGIADGIHVHALAEMFPQHSIIGYDPLNDNKSTIRDSGCGDSDLQN